MMSRARFDLWLKQLFNKYWTDACARELGPGTVLLKVALRNSIDLLKCQCLSSLVSTGSMNCYKCPPEWSLGCSFWKAAHVSMHRAEFNADKTERIRLDLERFFQGCLQGNRDTPFPIWEMLNGIYRFGNYTEVGMSTECVCWFIVLLQTLFHLLQNAKLYLWSNYVVQELNCLDDEGSKWMLIQKMTSWVTLWPSGPHGDFHIALLWQHWRSVSELQD